MHIQGEAFIRTEVEKTHYTAKMVFNANGAVFFPVNREHREMTAPGIWYADNYKGNAMAAMLSPGAIEIRYHRMFTDSDVETVLSALLAQPELACLREYIATYQGRPLSIPATE